MARQRSRDTEPELRIRRLLHAAGLRYRIHLRPLHHLRREADIVFTTARVAVFIDGCFWHGCPCHRSEPKVNSRFWKNKITANQARDAETNQLLAEAGWLALRYWEHEAPEIAAREIEIAVRSRTR